jgi:sugar/nucleoside kinase (ribokinase family)
LFELTVWFEPTDPNLAGKVTGLLNERSFSDRPLMTYASPNLTELEIMVESIKRGQHIQDKQERHDKSYSLPQLIQRCKSVGQHLIREKLVQTLVITLGDKGVVILHAVSSYYYFSRSSSPQSKF